MMPNDDQCHDPMREIDLILLEDVMRQGAIETNAWARSFQLAALLIVGACVLFVLVHDLTHSNTSISAPPAIKIAGPAGSVEYPGLSGSEAYRAEKCAGDYVCDEDGLWETIVGTRTEHTQSGLTAELSNAEQTVLISRSKDLPSPGGRLRPIANDP